MQNLFDSRLAVGKSEQESVSHDSCEKRDVPLIHHEKPCKREQNENGAQLVVWDSTDCMSSDPSQVTNCVIQSNTNHLPVCDQYSEISLYMMPIIAMSNRTLMRNERHHDASIDFAALRVLLCMTTF